MDVYMYYVCIFDEAEFLNRYIFSKLLKLTCVHVCMYVCVSVCMYVRRIPFCTLFLYYFFLLSPK